MAAGRDGLVVVFKRRDLTNGLLASPTRLSDGSACGRRARQRNHRDHGVKSRRMKVLVTGGAGFIGSITAKALEEAGHTPVILDSLLTGERAFVRDRIFYQGDIADRDLLHELLEDHPDVAVTLHMAARTIVPESMENPQVYYRDNVSKSLALLDELQACGLDRMVFSSSASLYAPSSSFEVREGDALAPASPYARTKHMVEQMLEDLCHATDMRGIALRYFNPIGSDPAMESGVQARDPSHVLGRMIQVARGAEQRFTLTGTDFPTRDGTGLRDYIHVWDLARAHVRAVERFDEVLAATRKPFEVINLGTGTGVTVRELLRTFQAVLGAEIPVVQTNRRPGDVAGAYANVDRAAELLGWRTELSVEEGIRSALAWAEHRQAVLGF